eukprot:6326857-Prymnesium_polylepis.2
MLSARAEQGAEKRNGSNVKHDVGFHYPRRTPHVQLFSIRGSRWSARTTKRFMTARTCTITNPLSFLPAQIPIGLPYVGARDSIAAYSCTTHPHKDAQRHTEVQSACAFALRTSEMIRVDDNPCVTTAIQTGQAPDSRRPGKPESFRASRHPTSMHQE